MPSQNRSSSPGRSSVRALDPSSRSAQSAHHRHRDAGQLALHQVGGGGDLVGDRDLGDHELVAVHVVRTGVAVQHRQTRRADRGVDLAVAPGPAHRVGDDDADGHAEPLAQAGAQRRGAAVGVDGQQRQFGRADVGAVDAGGGLHETEVVLGDQRAALAGQHPDRFFVDQLAPQRIPLLGILRRGHDAALALGQHLAGDHHDVVVAQPRRGGGQRGGEVVAGPELGQAGHRKELDRGRRTVLGHGLTPARSIPARTISAVVAGSVISSGTDRTSTPAISALSPSCTSQPSRMPTPERGAVVAADRFGGARHADHREALVGHAAQRLSGDDGGVADHARRGRAQCAADAGDRPGSRRC